MIEIPEILDERRLLTFRSSVRPDQWGLGEVHRLERLDHHRALYLEHEGEISGNRGHVKRVAEGKCIGLSQKCLATCVLQIAILWDTNVDMEFEYSGICHSNGVWEVRVDRKDSHPGQKLDTVL